MQIDVVVPVVVSVYFKRALVRRKRQPLTAELRRRSELRAASALCARKREKRRCGLWRGSTPPFILPGRVREGAR
jgi:hypothetical protein